MALKRKVLCITNAALLSASVYASSPDALDDNQTSVPVSVSGVHWMKTLKTVSTAALCSGGTYFALDEINRRMNMGIQSPYLTSVAAIVAAVSLYNGTLFASAPAQGGRSGAPVTGVTDASPSRNAQPIDIEDRLKAVETATGLFANNRNHASAYQTLRSAVNELNASVTVLRLRKDQIQHGLVWYTENLAIQVEKVEELTKENQALKVEAARNAGKDDRISDFQKLVDRLELQLHEAGEKEKQMLRGIHSLGKRVQRQGCDDDDAASNAPSAISTTSTVLRADVWIANGEPVVGARRQCLIDALRAYDEKVKAETAAAVTATQKARDRRV